MQKISTMRASGENIFEGQLTIGLDLGDRSSAYCVLNALASGINLWRRPRCAPQIGRYWSPRNTRDPKILDGLPEPVPHSSPAIETCSRNFRGTRRFRPATENYLDLNQGFRFQAAETASLVC